MRLADPEQPTQRLDVRLALPAAAAWASAAVALGAGSRSGPGAAALAGLGVLLLLFGRRRRSAVTLAAVLCCAGAAAGSATLHVSAASPAVLTRAAEAGVTGRVELVLTGDPMPVRAPPGVARSRAQVRFPARITILDVAGRRTSLRAPVFVLAPAAGWSGMLPGQRASTTARLAPADPGELIGAVVLPRAAPAAVAPAGRLQRLAGTIRAGLHRGVEPLPNGPAGLLPGLVIGDTSRLSAAVVEEFRATGLTHLVAVSGANLAIVVGTVLALTRRLGAGRRLGSALAGLTMLGFVVVARPSPSVLRAAVMAAVVLIGMSHSRRSAALPALAAATLGLVLMDPALARAPGFALSVCATAGIVLFAVPLRRRMPSACPDWLAAAIAVPLAAQMACTPILVALFGRLSLIAVPANLLAAPVVPPATVVGVLVGLTAPVVLPVARVLARLAQLPAAWLLLVAHQGAGVPGAQVGWPQGLPGAALAVTATAAGLLILRRRRLRALAAVSLAGAMVAAGGLARIMPAWPPAGWAVVACDVGQGDGLVLSAGAGTAVVVDAGPDPLAMDRCLRSLNVRTVPLVILSHPHADHVEGLPGVLRQRHVGEIQVGPLDEPATESARIRRWAAAAGVPISRAQDGERRSVGRLSWQVIGPRQRFVGTDSDPNNSSIVLRARLPGLTALLTGDIEIAAQQDLLDSGRDLSADLLKVPHHGSGRQVPALLDRVGARLAVASVGADNDYGHPAGATMTRLAAGGSHAFRTDRDGSVAFLRRGDAVVGVGRRGSGGRPPASSDPAGMGAGPVLVTACPAAVGRVRARRRTSPAVGWHPGGCARSAAPADTRRRRRRPARGAGGRRGAARRQGRRAGCRRGRCAGRGRR